MTTGADLQPKRSDAPLRGRRVLIDSLGCRTNLAEAEALCCEFRRKGAEIVGEAPYHEVRKGVLNDPLDPVP